MTGEKSAIFKQVQKLTDLIKGLIVNKFYGSILIKFENGKIVHVKKEESIRIS